MIKKFKNDEFDKIAILWLETNISTHNFINEDYWKVQFDNVKEMLPQAELFIYEEDEELQGFVGVIDNYIAGIFVSKNIQSKGIGKSLLDHVKTLRNELSLNVYKKNERAVTFYERESFEIKEHRIDENTNEVEYLMLWKRNL